MKSGPWQFVISQTCSHIEHARPQLHYGTSRRPARTTSICFSAGGGVSIAACQACGLKLAGTTMSSRCSYICHSSGSSLSDGDRKAVGEQHFPLCCLPSPSRAESKQCFDHCSPQRLTCFCPMRRGSMRYCEMNHISIGRQQLVPVQSGSTRYRRCA